MSGIGKGLMVMLMALLPIMPSTGVNVMEPVKPENPAVNTLVGGNNAFAVDLYQKLSVPEGNLFFSPYSVSSALAMTWGGAREVTAAEMKAALRFGLEQDSLHPAFRELNRVLAANTAASGQKLSIANGLCLTGGDVSADYKALLRESYEAEIFKGDLARINGWVKEKTQGKIDKILEQLDTNSACVILNAIYFKGSWEKPFDKAATRPQPFYTDPGRQIEAPLMFQETRFRLLDRESYQAAVLPYKGNAMSMVVLLPRQVDGLAGLQKELTAASLQKLLDALDKSQPRKAELYLPKFKMETKYDLVAPSQDLGIKEAFLQGKADFSGMGWKKGDLWIGQIKHKAFVEVNEEGTEAAGATGIEMVMTSIMTEQKPVFRADHPFIFLIRDNVTGSILFLGRVVDPR